MLLACLAIAFERAFLPSEPVLSIRVPDDPSQPEISPRAFCASCGVEIHAKGKFKKRFCSPACRALAWRSKMDAAELEQLKEFARQVADLVESLIRSRASSLRKNPPAELD